MKPQFKRDEIYIDLSKLSEEQQGKISVLINGILNLNSDRFLLSFNPYNQKWELHKYLYNGKELTYSQFLDMMGESEEVLQVENDWIKISDDNKPKFDLITEYWLYDGKEVWSDIFTLRMRMGNYKVTHYKEKELKPSPPKY